MRRFLGGAVALGIATAAPAQGPDVDRSSFYVPVRDGTKLAMTLYRPADHGRPVDGRFPVVFSFTPYRARFKDEKGVHETFLSEPGLKDLVAHGYVVAVADIRGKGASFGHRRGFQDRTEALDGRDLVEWLAHRPWSTGKVGMLGCSYLGGTTLQVASTAPPSLKAIFTGASDLDKYAFVRRGGIPAQFNTRPDEPASVDLATLPVDADRDGSELRTAVAQHAANTPMAPLWYGMPYRDSVSPLTGTRFWEEVGPYTYLDTIRRAGIATYFWGNWHDEPTEQVIKLAANLNGRLLIGPGSHCVPPPGFDLNGEVVRFFDQHLKGIDSGLAAEPRVHFYLTGVPEAQAWHSSTLLPGQDVMRTAFYLGAAAGGGKDGTLDSKPAAVGQDRFAVDYKVGSPDYFAFWVDAMEGHGPSYTSPALPADRVLLGFPIAHLRVAADRADANVFAYLEDVAPDGKAEVVSFGRLAAAQRKPGRAPYDNLGLPWQSGRQADASPLTPGKPVDMVFNLTPTGRLIPAGHRLRFVVTGADPRQRNLAAIRQTPPPVLSVERGPGSYIEVPLLTTAELQHLAPQQR